MHTSAIKARIQYQDIEDGSEIFYYQPIDQSATNPLEIDQLGITNKLQAYFHAHRWYNRQKYQNTTVEFETLAEASILGLSDRIQVADNTRSKVYDGEVLAQNGSTLTLSQPFTPEPEKTYNIFLQNTDGSIQSVGFTSNNDNRSEIVLDNPTGLQLALDLDLYARATYEIVESDAVRKQPFLIQEKTPSGNGIISIVAYNYDDRYYDNDQDYINNIVDINGNIIND